MKLTRGTDSFEKKGTDWMLMCRKTPFVPHLKNPMIKWMGKAADSLKRKNKHVEFRDYSLFVSL